MIEWMRVDELRREIGEDGFAEVVELFLEEVEDVIVRLGGSPNPRTYEEDLHFLKGSAWNLGFTEFGALCQDGERKAASGRADDIDIIAVIGCYQASKSVFIDRLAGEASGRFAPAA